jgi:hypothetical protein
MRRRAEAPDVMAADLRAGRRSRRGRQRRGDADRPSIAPRVPGIGDVPPSERGARPA